MSKIIVSQSEMVAIVQDHIERRLFKAATCPVVVLIQTIVPEGAVEGVDAPPDFQVLMEPRPAPVAKPAAKKKGTP
jgi:hypothetical protein